MSPPALSARRALRARPRASRRQTRTAARAATAPSGPSTPRSTRAFRGRTPTRRTRRRRRTAPSAPRGLRALRGRAASRPPPPVAPGTIARLGLRWVGVSVCLLAATLASHLPSYPPCCSTRRSTRAPPARTPRTRPSPQPQSARCAPGAATVRGASRRWARPRTPLATALRGAFRCRIDLSLRAFHLAPCCSPSPATDTTAPSTRALRRTSPAPPARGPPRRRSPRRHSAPHVPPDPSVSLAAPRPPSALRGPTPVCWAPRRRSLRGPGSRSANHAQPATSAPRGRPTLFSAAWGLCQGRARGRARRV